MDPKKVQGSVWALADRQHGVVTRRQLLDLGYGSDAIKHRLAARKLHPIATGVYAVGRPRVTRLGRWMAAVLSCGPDAAASHGFAAAVWGIGPADPRIEVCVPSGQRRRRPGIVVHRRAHVEVTRHMGIPVTPPVSTLVDLATRLPRDEVEAAVNSADRLDLVNPEDLRAALDSMPRRPGKRALRAILDRRTFVATDSTLERLFLPLAHAAGLSMPETGVWLNGYKVDFHWPDLGLVVETDGLLYHRTPAQQAKDRRRDQVHAAAGLTTLRFTHAQVKYEPADVVATLTAVTRIAA